MGLKVWLPLKGNLVQQGTSNTIITNSGAVVNTSGKIGNCYTFDGSMSYISLKGQELFNVFKGGTYPFSIMMWVYHTDNARAILFGDYSITNGINFNIELTASHQVRFYWNGDPDHTFSNTTIGANTWTHIAVTYDGSKLQSYINGVACGSWTGTLSAKNKVINESNTSEFRLGRDGRTGDTALNGRLNDLRIYDHCLSIAEIQDISSGLVLHYKLDSLNIQDDSGYNNNGSILNVVSLSNDTPRYLHSIDLPNGNSAINCGRGGMMTDSITVNIWLKSSAWTNPISCTEGGGWNFEASGDYFRFPVYISGIGYKYGESTTTRAQICNNEWHMLTGVYDRINQKIKIYVDGKLDDEYDTDTSNVISYHTSNVIWIGAEASGSATVIASNGMTGLFSDFRIYSTPLSDDAIRQLYEVGEKIDNLQNLHSFELIENSMETVQFTKYGQIKCRNVIENNTVQLGKQNNLSYVKSNKFLEI